jgi:hypothetical protein
MIIFEYSQLMIGWLLGVVTLFLGERVSQNRSKRRISNILISEVESNYKFLKILVSLKDIISVEGELSISDGSTINVLKARWLPPLPIEFSVFEATLTEQGDLSLGILVSVRRFYAACKEVERFLIASEDETGNTEAQRIGYWKDAIASSDQGVGIIENESLLEHLRTEGNLPEQIKYRIHKLRERK